MERHHQFRFGNHSGLAVSSDQARRIEVPAPSKVDQSPVNYKRVAEADGKEVPWDQIVKGHEYEKGKFVIIKDEDFARVDVEATLTVNIINFVSMDEVDPLLFYKPYYLEVGKGGDKAYVLLRDALVEFGKNQVFSWRIRDASRFTLNHQIQESILS